MYAAKVLGHFRNDRRRAGQRDAASVRLLLLLLLLDASRVPRLPHMPRALLRHNYIVQIRPQSDRLRDIYREREDRERRHESVTGPAKGHLRRRTRTDIILSSLCSPPPATATPRRPLRPPSRARHPPSPPPPLVTAPPLSYRASSGKPARRVSLFRARSPSLVRPVHSILSIPRPRDATRNAPRHP